MQLLVNAVTAIQDVAERWCKLGLPNPERVLRLAHANQDRGWKGPHAATVTGPRIAQVRAAALPLSAQAFLFRTTA